MNEREKAELEQLRKEKMDRMNEEIRELKKCLKIVLKGFEASEEVLLNMARRIEKLENKEKENNPKGIAESMDRMFG